MKVWLISACPLRVPRIHGIILPIHAGRSIAGEVAFFVAWGLWWWLS